MAYDDGNTTGFPSPATIYLEAVIDLAEILDLRRPSRYPVRVTGGSLPARGIAERDILVVDWTPPGHRFDPAGMGTTGSTKTPLRLNLFA